MMDKIRSIRDKLRNIAVKQNVDFVFILRLYFQERILYRLSISRYKSSFILKGGLLLSVFNVSSFRPTKDIDLLGRDMESVEEDLLNVFKEILSPDLSGFDGIVFKTESMSVARIMENNVYEGLRISVTGFLGNIRDKITIDIGFGDVITPGPLKIDYPAFLNDPVNLLAYNYESIIAEKIEACCKLGFLTSRMKDFFDIMFLLKNRDIDFAVLENAVNATFKQRHTPKDSYKTLLKNDFIKEKERDWKRFLAKIKHGEKISFSEAIMFIDSKIGGMF